MTEVNCTELNALSDALWDCGIDVVDAAIHRDNEGKALASVEIEVNEFEQLVAYARHVNRPLLNYLSGLSPELLFDCGGHTDESGYWCDARTVQFTVSFHIPVAELGLLGALLKREPDSQQGNSIAA